MAEISFPAVTVSGFRVDVDDGTTAYQSAYSLDEFNVKTGPTRLTGNIRFAPSTWAEDALLQAFLLDLGDDPDHHVFLPWYRDGGRGEGVFSPGATFAVTSVADVGTVESTLVFTYGADDTFLYPNVGAMMSLNDVLVRFRTVEHVESTRTVTARVFPRVASASPNALTEGRVKARLTTALLGRTTKRGLDPVTMPWREVS